MLVFVRALSFLRLNLTFPMETKAVVYIALFGPRFRICRDSFDFLSDGRSYEGCEGAGEGGRLLLDRNVSSCTTKIKLM